jgi:hypothetical protein
MATAAVQVSSGIACSVARVADCAVVTAWGQRCHGYRHSACWLTPPPPGEARRYPGRRGPPGLRPGWPEGPFGHGG